MKVISWNLLHGMAIPPAQLATGPGAQAVDGEAADAAIARLESAVLKLEVDVLGIQEIDVNQSRSMHVHHVQEIAQIMGTGHWAFAPTLIGTPGGKWRAVRNDVNAAQLELITSTSGPLTETAYGIGLISKVPVKKWHRLELGRSIIGLPLAVPTKRGVGLAYVKDEPRVAIAAELENGFTVAVTHLSFVPFVNYFQLKKMQRWISQLPGTPIIMGDLNLPWNLPEKSGWKSLAIKKTYPSWSPKIQFDYILTSTKGLKAIVSKILTIPPLGVSDHLPIGVELNFKPLELQ
jgi:endonuclease/exonuclease/phosphatase family metal-dependent hydrolase